MGAAEDRAGVEARVARLAALGCATEEIALTLGVSCAVVAEAFRAVVNVRSGVNGGLADASVDVHARPMKEEPKDVV